MKLGPLNIVARRSLVVLGVSASLLVGLVSIRAAAAWTAAAAPLAAPPVSVDAISQQLTQEQSRSAALETQLAALVNQSTTLTKALKAAQGRIASDAATASVLRGRLATAQQQLLSLAARLQAGAQAAAAKAAKDAARAASAPTPAPAYVPPVITTQPAPQPTPRPTEPNDN